MNFGKRGISALVGYVLLVSLSVAMAGVIYAWLGFYAKPESLFVEQSCPDVSFVISSYSCASSVLTLSVQNRGNFDIDGYSIKINNGQKDINLYPQGTNFKYSTVKIASGQTSTEKFDFTTADRIKSIEIEALKGTDSSGKPILCENSIVKQTVPSGTCVVPGKSPEYVPCTKADTDGEFCSKLGKNCGSISGTDNCGNPRNNVNCGTCTSGTCISGVCCNVQTCASLGKNCGSWSDNCGKMLDCGATCPANQLCVNGVCCAPYTCTSLNYNCGTWSNNCGGTLECGTCTSGTCTNGRCCIPNCAGKTCGDNGCGGSCGTACTGGQQCVNGVCSYWFLDYQGSVTFTQLGWDISGRYNGVSTVKDSIVDIGSGNMALHHEFNGVIANTAQYSTGGIPYQNLIDTIEARLRVTAAVNQGQAAIHVYGARFGEITITFMRAYTSIFNSACSSVYYTDNSAFHIYKIVMKNNRVVVYDNNNPSPVLSCTYYPQDTYQNFIYRVDGGTVDLDYLKAGVCVPSYSCSGKQCGEDGCGTPCPPGCSSGQICESGQCKTVVFSYEADALPQSSSPAWTKYYYGSPTESIFSEAGNILRNTASENQIYYIGAKNLIPSPAGGYTAKFRARMNSCSGGSMIIFATRDGTQNVLVYIACNSLKLCNPYSSGYSFNPAGFHNYKLTVSGSTARLYVDDGATPVLENTACTPLSVNELFYQVSSSGGPISADLDYIKVINGII